MTAKRPSQLRLGLVPSHSQQHLLSMHQQELISSATRCAAAAVKPGSPRLIPLGSPGGVVTPMMLEAEGKGGGGGYFAVEAATAAGGGKRVGV